MRNFILLVICITALVGCTARGSKPSPGRDEQKLSATRWSEKSELFVEYTPLIAGEKARFAVHFTNLNDFKPVAAGPVTVELRREGVSESFTTPGPSKPGIFGLDVQPQTPGAYTMLVRVDSPGLKDSHEIAGVTVYSDSKQARSGQQEKLQEETIAFLKEQQWSLDFATATVSNESVRDSLRFAAEVRPRTGGEVQIAAPVGGRLTATSTVPAVGTHVEKGQALGRLVPKTSMPADRSGLEAAAAEAKAAYDLARKDRERAERLLAARAIPAKRVDEAQAAEITAEARIKSAKARLAQHEVTRNAEEDVSGVSAFVLRAPISGVVSQSLATPGASVEDGQHLFTIVAVDTVHVVANVPESEAPRLKHVTGAEMEVPGVDQPLPLRRLVSIGKVVDPASRTLSVVYEFANNGHVVAVGQSAFLRLFNSERTTAATVPDSAVVDDAGRPVLFVQRAGEAFVRRPVKLGNREGGRVQIVEGVKPGERVVTRGAYLVRLSAMSSQIPAHGHVH